MVWKFLNFCAFNFFALFDMEIIWILILSWLKGNVGVVFAVQWLARLIRNG